MNFNFKTFRFIEKIQRTESSHLHPYTINIVFSIIDVLY